MAKAISKAPILDQICFNTETRDLFAFIPDVHFFIKDLKGRLIYCNETHRLALYRFVDVDQLYGKQNKDFFPEVLAQAFTDDDRRVIKTGQPLLEQCELNITATGALRWFCTTKIPARDGRGQIVGLIGISRRLESMDTKLAEYELLSPALDYIHTHSAENINISLLAQICGLTESSFRREFKRLFRMPPLRFILRLRIQRACLRLSSGTASIADVAYECGFDDQNYFARYFKRNIGLTPTEYRSKRQEHLKSP